MPVEHTELILGQGDVYFGRFADGTKDPIGEAYIGNTMQFQVTFDVTTLARFDSIGGQKVPVEGPIVNETHSVKFNTDNMTMDNLARWYGGVPIEVAQPAVVAASETIVVQPGMYYQLGVSAASPAGLRNLSNVGASILADLEIDNATGRVYVPVGVPANTGITFTYNVANQSFRRVLSSKKELLGSLRFVANNRHGENRHVFFPYVRLKVEGAYDLKLDEWQNLTFTAEGRRKNSRTEYVYIEGN